MKKKCSATVIMQVAATWLIHLRAVGRSRRTISTYETAIKNLDRFLARRHRCDPRNVRPSDVEEWRRLLVRTGCQPATVNQFLRTAGYLFRWLVAEGRVFGDPTAAVAMGKAPGKLGVCPNEKEMRRLLESIHGRDAIARRDRALLELAYGTGARLEEMVGLDLQSIDLPAGVARLLGKGARERVVPLTTAAVRALNTYITRARPNLVSNDEPESALFISSKDGKRLHSSAVAAVVRSRARRAGFSLTPHAIRRAVGSHLLRAGAPLAQVKELLGHQSYRHLHHYLQLYPGQVIAEVRRSKPGRR